MRTEHRYELKFLVGATQKNQLLSRLSEGLEPDPFGAAGVYRVSSQYFDSPARSAYWEKLDGVPFRRKFRLRYYGEDLENTTAFFEIKHRWDQTVFKERIPLKSDRLEELFASPGALNSLHQHVPELNSGEGRTLESILQAAAGNRLEGANIISYQREAWVGKVDHRLRVTFDHLCRAHPPGEPSTPLGGAGAPLLPDHEIVLEVKFNRRLPVWLRDALCLEQIRPIRFSKYVEGILARERQKEACYGSSV